MADNKMLIDATHPEETRVVVLRGGRVEEFDYESAARKLLRGNIYLAKVTRVEPALQAAFVDYGGNRHGFLAFNEIHPDYYQIPMADRQALIEEEAKAAVEDDDDSSESDTFDADDDVREDDEPSSDFGQAEDGVEAASDAGDAPEADDESDQAASSPQAEAEAEAEAEDEPESGDTESGDTESGDTDSDTTPGTDSIAVAAQSDPTLSEEAPDVSADEPAQPVDAANNEDSNSADVLEASGEENAAGEPADEAASVEATEALDENGVPVHIGLVEDEGVDDVDTETEAVVAEPVDEVGAQDALEEVPSRPRRRSRRSYKIQEVIKRRQILLVQVVKEERGNKGAALTTYLSLAGRYTVLMPNTARGGGVSRKISSPQDRKRMKAIAADLDVPEGMGLIIRTAGASRTKQEIRRDFEYLLRLWESVREATLESTAPSLVYEEGNLIKRSIRDLYSKEVDEIIVAGEHAHKDAKGFMRMLMPSHSRNVTLYKAPEPLFTRFQIERQLNAMFSPQVPLRSGGYLVINQTEALVAVDVNSGRSTREFSIEETALHTNLEAADEVARQLKLRDLAGLIVIDFIDMDEKRNNRAVERRVNDALRNDRARIQVGRISHFGLMEMSRQRMRTGVLEGSTSQCSQCQGTGIIRSTESVSLAVLRGLEDTVMAGSRAPLIALTTRDVALYILNSKREFIDNMEARLGQSISIQISEKMVGADFKIEKGVAPPRVQGSRAARSVVNMDSGFEDGEAPASGSGGRSEQSAPERDGAQGDEEQPRKRRRRRRSRRPSEDMRADRNDNGGEDRGGEDRGPENRGPRDDTPRDGDGGVSEDMQASGDASASGERTRDEHDEDGRPKRSRRRGRRGGRRNRERREAKNGTAVPITENQGEGLDGNEGEQPGSDVDTNGAPDSGAPGMGPQPDFNGEPSSDAGAVEPVAEVTGDVDAGDGAELKKPARAPRRRRSPSRSRRASSTPESEDAAPSTDTGVESADGESDGGTDEADAKPAAASTRRRKKETPPQSIEISSVRVGSSTPEGGSDSSAPETKSEPDPSKPARTGWWQRRLMGGD